MTNTTSDIAAQGVAVAQTKDLKNGQVHYAVEDGTLLVTTVSETGLGTHTRFIHNVPGLSASIVPTGAPQTPTMAMAQQQSKQDQKSNGQYRETQVNAFSPSVSSFGHSIGNSVGSALAVNSNLPARLVTPSTPRGRRPLNGTQPANEGMPLVRSPAVVLDSPSLGRRADGWLTDRVGIPSTSEYQVRPAINGLGNILDLVPTSNARMEKRRQEEEEIIEREMRNLQAQNELAWMTMDDFTRRIEGGEADSEMGEYDNISSSEEEMEYVDFEQANGIHRRTDIDIDEEMDGRLVGVENECHSSAGGTPHPSFASNEISTPSMFRDQFGNLYHSFSPNSSIAARPVNIGSVVGTQMSSAMETEGQNYIRLSASNIFHRPTRSSVPGLEETLHPNNMQRFVTPDNAGLIDNREVPPAPAAVRIRAFAQPMESRESSVFVPTPGLTPRQAERYLPSQSERLNVSSGANRRKKILRWGESNPIPTRESTPFVGPPADDFMASPRQHLTQAEKRLELQRKLYGTRAPELKKRVGNVLLRPASEVLAESLSTVINTEMGESSNAFIGRDPQMFNSPSYVVQNTSEGVRRFDSLKENSRPLTLSPGRGSFHPMQQHTTNEIEIPFLTPVQVVPIEVASPLPKTPASGSRSRRRVSDVMTSPRLTRSRAKTAAQYLNEPTPRSTGKGKGREI